MRTRRAALVVAGALGLVAALLVGIAEPSGAWTRSPQRIAGIDRYQTSVDLSNAAFQTGAPAVVLVSGESFPDGLSAGPLAALLGGPVLLTTRDQAPETVLNEIKRLAPTTVVIVGGPAAVSDDVASVVAGITAVVPDRIAGENRYDTAAQVAARFPTGGKTAYAASGVDFPDALAAGAAAAGAGVPLLLVGPTGAPPVATAALSRLQPAEVRVLGGASAVNDDAVAQLQAVVPNVRRIAGADRYATAQALASTWMEGATGKKPAEALVATGSSFPDALAAAPLAAKRGAPIVLTAQPCSPQPTVDVLRDMAWPDVTVVGGATVVSSAAANLVPCSPVPDGLLAPGLVLTTQVLPGPTIVHLITVDRRQGYDLRVVPTTGRVNGIFPTTGLARKLQTLVAVNGDFFDSAGEPTHGLAANGRILRWGGMVNTLVGFDPNKPTYGFFGKPAGGIDVDTGVGSPLPVGLVNMRPPSGEQLALVTPEWTKAFPPGEWCRAVLAPAGQPTVQADGRTFEPQTVQSSTCSTDPIPRTGDVLVATPVSGMGATIAGLATGSSVTVRWRVHPTDKGVLDVLGANATLVFGSRVASDVTNGQGQFYARREARTAVAQKPDGVIMIAVVDKSPGWSIGMTPRELANHLISMGAIDAANLDGGGSSAMAVRGVLANRPADGAERSVNTSLVIVPHGTDLSAAAARKR
jgi:putative cell wall-binding protein